VTATCTKCRARQLPGEQWTQNGHGHLCERCSPLVSNMKQGLGRGRGLGLGGGLPPLSAPSSSSSFHNDDVPTRVDWLLHKDDNPHVDLPPKVKAVADFFTKVHSLRVKAGEHRPVPFGCEWVGGHLGMSKTTVWRALRILESEGVIRRMDPLPGRGKKGVDTYLPGGGGAS
jgi:hypothetical protein